MMLEDIDVIENKSFYIVKPRTISKTACYRNCKFYVLDKSALTVTNNVCLLDCTIYIEKLDKSKCSTSDSIVLVDLQAHHIDDEKIKSEFVMRSTCQ